MSAAEKLTDDEDLPDIPAVEFGGTPQARINYLSVSQLKSAAYWTNEGCLRKWFLKKVKGLPEPMRGNLELGKQVHAQLEHYAKTGDPVLGDIARAALRFFPARDSIIGIEVSITESNRPEIVGAKLKADGIPLVGFIDRVDLPLGGPVRVVDYKTSKNPEAYGASPEDLTTTATGPGIQMVGYTVAVAEDLGPLTLDDSDTVEVEHLYLHTKPTKKQVDEGKDAMQVVGHLTVGRARAEWRERIDPLAAKLREVARCSDVTQVEPNTNACGAFGGCAFYATCLVADSNPSPQQEKRMSLAEIMKKRREAAAAAGSAPSTPPPPEPKPESRPDPVIVPPDAPKSDPAKAAEPMPESAPPVETAAPAETEKPKRGRKPKTAGAAEVVTYDAGAAEYVEAARLELFVDCVPNSPAAPLAPYIAERLAAFTKAFPDLIDVRCSPKKTADGKDHPLAYGAWKGALATECRLHPPTPGRYFVLGAAQNEIASVVVEALEPSCSEFVRGVR